MVTKGYQKGVYDRVTEEIVPVSLERCKLAPIEETMQTLMQRRRSNQLISSIDIAGFLSVLVVVLYIIMSPYAVVIDRHGKYADLPYVSHPVSMPGANREDAIMVVIERDGRVWVGDDRADLSQIPALIQEQIRNRSPKVVYFRADARVEYKIVRDVLGAVRSTGLEKVAFLVYERKTNGQQPY